jgi:hypothetical protein
VEIMEKEDLIIVDKLLCKIKVVSDSQNKPVTVYGSSKDLKCIGLGTDAAVFQYAHKPAYAFKLFADDKKIKIQTEAKVYQELKGSPFFPICYAATDRYLVLSFESGVTLYDCILQGIHIPEQAILDVEKARSYAREKNLNPRDIHLKNILLQNGRAKVIDVSEYMKTGDDARWEHLKMAYDEFYHLIDGKPIPAWLLEKIQSWYNLSHYSSKKEFLKDSLQVSRLWRPYLNKKNNKVG